MDVQARRGGPAASQVLVGQPEDVRPVAGIPTLVLDHKVPLMVADHDTVRLAVRDRGLGIPEERRAHIFDRFYRTHADHHRSGLGLGLYISHEIVALHGGGWRRSSPPMAVRASS